MNNNFIDSLVKLIKFWFSDFFDVDDYFIFIELTFIIFDFLFERVDEGLDWTNVMKMIGMVFTSTWGT